MNDGPPDPVEERPAATPEVAELRSEVNDLRMTCSCTRP
jgi:hypothetical protein